MESLAAMSAEELAEKSKMTTDQAALVIRTAKATLLEAELAGSKEKIAAITAETLAEKLGITTDQAAIVVDKIKNGMKLSEALAEQGLTAAKGSSVVATLAQIAANLGLTASLGPVLGIVALVALAFAGLVATIMIVVAVFNKLKNSTPEAKLASAKEESARLAEELTKAKEAASKLKETIEGYDSAVDKLKLLKKGTEEYKQAVEEANEKARELIDQSEGLEGKYHFNAESGLIEFDAGALEQAQEAADKKVKVVQAQKLMADNSVMTAENAVNTKEMVKEDAGTKQAASIAAGAFAGVAGPALGAALAAHFIPAFTVAASVPIVGAVAGIAGVVTGVGKLVADAQQTGALENLQEAFQKMDGDFVGAFNSLSGIDQRLIKSLGMTDAELQKLCAETQANTQAIIENNKQIVDSTFEGNKAYDSSS